MRRLLLAAALVLCLPAQPYAQDRLLMLSRHRIECRVGETVNVQAIGTARDGRVADRTTSSTTSWFSLDNQVAKIIAPGAVRCDAPGEALIAAAWPGGADAAGDTARIVVIAPAPAPEPDPEPDPAPDPLGQIRIFEGDGQQGTPGEVLDEIVVEIRDTRGRRVTTPTDIVWTTGEGSGSIIESEGTGSDGRAGARWRLGERIGTQTAQACASGFGCVTFHALVTDPDGWELVLEWCHPRVSRRWQTGELPLHFRSPGVPDDSAFVRAVRVWPDGRREPEHNIDEWVTTGPVIFQPVAPGTPTPCGRA